MFRNGHNPATAHCTVTIYDLEEFLSIAEIADGLFECEVIVFDLYFNCIWLNFELLFKSKLVYDTYWYKSDFETSR